MILVLDSGNSRMKWGLWGPRGWLAQGVVPNQELAKLAVRDWQNLQRPSRVVGVNVAGEAARVRVEGQIARWRIPVEWLSATRRGAGVINSYADRRSSAPIAGPRWSPRGGARWKAMRSAALVGRSASARRSPWMPSMPTACSMEG